MEPPSGFADFIAENERRLLRAGWLLTGDSGLAEDLVQTALAKSWRQWDAIAPQSRFAYVQRVLVTTWIAGNKRRWSGEVPTGFAADQQAARDILGAAELRIVLLAALDRLAPRQRATLVLRYFLDLSESDTAAALGCSIGSVKTHAARGLGVLRATPGLGLDLLEGETR